ncbi:hypothetical protein MMC31_008052 [Peltigera leucophlebia]|nr:hypothetical protein [Peltigera leucophlebia]
MHLPTELQAEIINQVRIQDFTNQDYDDGEDGYSTLRSLCLVSKHLSDIATRCLYYHVRFYHTFLSIEDKIDSLLIQPANLKFIRVLEMDRKMPYDESLQIYQFLGHLPKDSLEEIHYTPYTFKEFPFHLVIEFLWHHQKNIRNLRLITYMVQWLMDFSQKEGHSDILKFFTYLDIHGDSEQDNSHGHTEAASSRSHPKIDD